MSEANELVSIIIPFYNSERFLADSVESVLAQTYTHWELLLVDDGSTDTSPEIARKYAARHSESIRCLEHAGHRNHGLAFTRNFGVKNSRGEYLAFLDSDDLWLPHKLATQVARMGENPGAGLLVSPSEYWYDWDPHGLPIRESKVPQLAPGERLYMPPTLLISTHPLGPWGAPCPSSFFMRRSAFDAVGGFEHRLSVQGLSDRSGVRRRFMSRSVPVSSRLHVAARSQFRSGGCSTPILLLLAPPLSS